MKSSIDELLERVFGVNPRLAELDSTATGRAIVSSPTVRFPNNVPEKPAPLKFRKLTDEEVSSAKTRIERDCKKLGIPSLVWAFNPDRFKICYQINGNYTICMIQADGEVLTTGASRCNPRDQFDEKIGQALSFNRAMSAC